MPHETPARPRVRIRDDGRRSWRRRPDAAARQPPLRRRPRTAVRQRRRRGVRQRRRSRDRVDERQDGEGLSGVESCRSTGWSRIDRRKDRSRSPGEGTATRPSCSGPKPGRRSSLDNAGVVAGNEVFKDRETGSRWQQSRLTRDLRSARRAPAPALSVPAHQLAGMAAAASRHARAEAAARLRRADPREEQADS